MIISLVTWEEERSLRHLWTEKKVRRICLVNLIPKIFLLCLPWSQRPREAEERQPGNDVVVSPHYREPQVLQAELSWTHMDCPELTWTVLNSPELSWTALNSPELSWTVLNSPELSWTALNSPELAWTALNSPELSWTALNWREMTWTEIRSLLFIQTCLSSEQLLRMHLLHLLSMYASVMHTL